MLMTAPILLGILAVVFAVAPILFRSNAVYIFLALCAGEILARLTAQDVTQIVNSIITVDVPMFSIVQIVLLLIAPVLLLFMYRRTAKADLIIQIIPGVSAALLAFMFIVAKLPYDTQTVMQDSQLYGIVKPFFGVAAAAGLGASVVWFWAKKPKHDKHEKKKHHG